MGRNTLDFWHGTNRPFNIGDHILPQALTGATNVTHKTETSLGDSPDEWKEEHAYASADPSLALGYAMRAEEVAGGKKAVYRVEPLDPSDVEHDSWDESKSKKGWKVVGKLPDVEMDSPLIKSMSRAAEHKAGQIND